MEIDCNPHQDIDAKIRALLHDTFHLTALYPYQELVIRTVLERDGLYGKEIQIEAPDHQLVVLPTGSGKSICFMLPSLLLKGITLVVYPLLALMTDQARRMEVMGFETIVLKGSQSDAERVINWENRLRLGVSPTKIQLKSHISPAL
ncbi:MAG: DEAD/DEAH box helicase [Sphaerochaetaceae bacterium]|jgi:ATP-dependent DNA helicase RecQ|nr:DEAD/DEAH box helicase [Sphaerochaetaceae bacterium]